MALIPVDYDPFASMPSATPASSALTGASPLAAALAGLPGGATGAGLGARPVAQQAGLLGNTLFG